MTNALADLRASLEKAVDLIDGSLLLPIEKQLNSDELSLQNTMIEFPQANSLIDQCDKILAQYNSSKPVIRLIHHFACSGGTLVSKCIAALPNVFLLSEVHPYSELQRNKAKPQYSPSDLAKLSVYAGVPGQKELAAKIFIASIKEAYLHIHERGGTLVLREHSHSDYCVGEAINHSTVSQLLTEYFEIKSLVTLRNPIDSYLSLLANDWVHFKPANFDEYCNRLILFLEPFNQEQIILYEDFVQRPQKVLEQACSTLQVSFDDTFEAIYETSFVTGDSGRKGSDIGARLRRDCSESFMLEVKKSKCFQTLGKRFGFA
jgi:hypothetical protein